MKRLFPFRGGVAALFALAALAAIPAATARPDASSQPIKFMVISAVGTSINNYPDALAGVEAAVATLNRSGGIKGRRIEVLFCNNQSQATTAAACARQAVSENVDAVVGQASQLVSFEEPILAAAGIPDVGLYVFSEPINWSNPNIFPLTGGSSIVYQAIPFAVKQLKKKRFVIVYQDVSAAQTSAKLALKAARAAKIPFIATMTLPGLTTDFAPYAQKLRDFNADAVMMINSAGPSGGLMRTATELGIRPLWAHQQGTIGEPEAQQIGAPTEGMLLASPFPSYRDTADPGIRRWVAEMKAAGKDQTINLKPAGLNGWIAVHGIARVAKNIKGEFNRTTLKAALRAQKKPMDMFGLVDWAPGKRGPAAYPNFGTALKYYFLTFRNGQLTKYPGVKPVFPLVEQRFVR